MAFNPLQNYLQGQQAGSQNYMRGQQADQAQEANRLAGALTGQMAQGQDISRTQNFQDIMAIDPDRGNQMLNTFSQLSKERKQSTYEDMITLKNLLDNGDIEGASEFTKDRTLAIGELGGDPSGTEMWSGLIAEGRIDELRNGLNQGLEKAYALGELKAPKSNRPKEFANVVSPVQVDQDTGQQYVIITNPTTQQSKRVTIEGATALTNDEKDKKDIRQSLIKDAIKVGGESYEGLKVIRNGLSAYSEAIDAIDEGASSGRLQSYFPSFEESTLKLENAGSRLGLNVIQATTFGALSEGELRLAMETAMPPLEPVALRKWLVTKKKAQQKLGAELLKMAVKLGKGKTTIADYLESVNYAEKDLSTDEELLNKYGL